MEKTVSSNGFTTNVSELNGTGNESGFVRSVESRPCQEQRRSRRREPQTTEQTNIAISHFGLTNTVQMYIETQNNATKVHMDNIKIYFPQYQEDNSSSNMTTLGHFDG